MTTPYLQIEGLTKYYGDVKAVDQVDMTIAEGSTAAIIGSSGCGKSTFLRCLNLLEHPTSGTMTIGPHTLRISDGEIVGEQQDALPFRKQMAMVFQSFDLFPHMTALRNITLAPTVVNQSSTKNAEEEALSLLEMMGLKNKAYHYPGQLSGGQAQRVAIARALAMNPRVLLFDEATSALDPELVGEVLEVMRGLADEGRTMVVVTHELTFAQEVADEVFYFDEGRVVESGRPSELFANPGSDRLKAFLQRYQSRGIPVGT